MPECLFLPCQIFMKRLLVIPVMFLYLLAVSGVMINLHYCGATLESWSLYAKSEGCDEGECGDETDVPDDCCNDETITGKVSQHPYLAENIKLKIASPEWTQPLPVFTFDSYKSALESFSERSFNAPNAPPGLWQYIPLYKLHSSLAYYG